MKVSELIMLLNALPPDLEVVTNKSEDDWEYYRIDAKALKIVDGAAYNHYIAPVPHWRRPMDTSNIKRFLLIDNSEAEQ